PGPRRQRRRIDAGEHVIDHQPLEVLAVAHVPVKRHRPHAKLVRHGAHRERGEAIAVGDRQRRGSDVLDGERLRPGHDGLTAYTIRSTCTSMSVHRTPTTLSPPYLPGDRVAPRTLIALTGDGVEVPDGRSLVHLQFRRFAGCPICDLHLRSISRRAADIAAAGVREVVVFHSDAAELREY